MLDFTIGTRFWERRAPQPTHLAAQLRVTLHGLYRARPPSINSFLPKNAIILVRLVFALTP